LKTIKINHCPGTLASGFETYSPNCLKKMFDGKKVSHILDYELNSTNEEILNTMLDNRKRISVSGVQEKMSLVLVQNKLKFTEPGERGRYILKPIPYDLRKKEMVPANEHLTMQIAKQIFGINTAENAMIFFKSGEPAYITKRFDFNKKGEPVAVEDFASLAGRTSEIAGSDYKYNFSYEELGELIKKYIPSWKIEIEKYFSISIFNFLFSNGDAHLKNFSIIQTSQNDYILAPAYDLLNTNLHIDDSDFALSKGLFVNDYKSEKYKKFNHPCLEDFIQFGKRIGISDRRVQKILTNLTQHSELVKNLVQKSFLDEKSRKTYNLHYQTRLNHLLK
jgi:serine/threonine-protein kinase HipA